LKKKKKVRKYVEKKKKKKKNKQEVMDLDSSFELSKESGVAQNPLLRMYSAAKLRFVLCR